MTAWSEERLLVISPHPDDEVIGCGGLIAKAKDEGSEVLVQYLTVGDTHDYSANGFSSAAERTAEVAKVAELLAFDDWDVALPGNDHHLRLDTLAQRELIGLLEAGARLSIQRSRPSVVLIPQRCSYNQDHRVVAQAAMTCLRPVGPQHRFRPQAVLAYEQIADQWNVGDGLAPNLFVELTRSQMDRKLDAMSAYVSQQRTHPHTRSREALESMAGFRGAHSGVAFAEAYHCLRWMR